MLRLVLSGVHDDEDPEYSILKQRMVNKLKDEGISDVKSGFTLVDITKVAERTISTVSARAGWQGVQQSLSGGRHLSRTNRDHLSGARLSGAQFHWSRGRQQPVALLVYLAAV